MTLNVLTMKHIGISAMARDRITGIGASQYDLGHRQKFQDMTVDEIAQGLIEELLDVINYATFLAIKVQTWSDSVRDS